MSSQVVAFRAESNNEVNPLHKVSPIKKNNAGPRGGIRQTDQNSFPNRQRGWLPQFNTNVDPQQHNQTPGHRSRISFSGVRIRRPKVTDCESHRNVYDSSLSCVSTFTHIGPTRCGTKDFEGAQTAQLGLDLWNTR